MDDTIHGIRQARILQWVDMTFSTFALTGDKLNLKVPSPVPPTSSTWLVVFFFSLSPSGESQPEQSRQPSSRERRTRDVDVTADAKCLPDAERPVFVF